MRTVLIGGTGIVGPDVAHALSRLGQVVVVSRGQSTASLPAGVRLVHADRRAPGQLESVIRDERPDALVDLACFDASDARLLLAAADGVARVVMVSSVNAVGPVAGGPVTDDSAAAPVSDYGRDKLAAEHLIQAAWTRGGPRPLIVRLGPVYRTGAPMDGQLAEDGYWLAHLVARQQAVLADDGAALWNLLHATDAGSAIAALTANPAAEARIVLLGSRYPLPWRSFYEIVHQGLGVPFSVASLPADWLRAQLTATLGAEDFLAEISGWDQRYEMSALAELAPHYDERADHRRRLVEAARWLVGAGMVGDPGLADLIAALPRRWYQSPAWR